MTKEDNAPEAYKLKIQFRENNTNVATGEIVYTKDITLEEAETFLQELTASHMNNKKVAKHGLSVIPYSILSIEIVQGIDKR